MRRARADTDGVRAVLAVLALAFLPAYLAPAATQPTLTATQFVADLNLKRVTNGLPPVIENPAWLAACAAHVNYLHLNPTVLDSDWPGPHEETPGKPGYSAEGVLGGGHGDLAWGYDSTADVWAGKVWDDPWEDAPGHLSQLLDPFVDEVGFAFAHGIMCAMAGDSYVDGYIQHGAGHDTNRVYTYPGDGTNGIYISESAGESPATPAELAGIKSDVTGPYLFVKIDGPWLIERGGGMHDAQASLTGPAGPVAIRTLLPSDMPSGMSFMVGYGDAILLPLKPLQPATTYTATIAATWGATPFTHTWSFTTAGTTPAPKARQQATLAHVEATLTKRNLTVR